MRGRVVFVLAAVTLLGAFLVPSAGASPTMTVSFLDVGQGDSIWIKTPEGQDILIDGAPATPGGAVVSYLFNHGCTDVEHILLMHPPADPPENRLHVAASTFAFSYPITMSLRISSRIRPAPQVAISGGWHG